MSHILKKALYIYIDFIIYPDLYDVSHKYIAIAMTQKHFFLFFGDVNNHLVLQSKTFKL